MEIAWMTVLRAADHLPADVCEACKAIAAGQPRNPRAKGGATCRATYFLGAPLLERCNVSRYKNFIDSIGPHAHCVGTVNDNPDPVADDEVVRWPPRWGGV